MLRKVEAFYGRHPYAEGKINPHSIDVMHSKDPAVRKQRRAGVPLNQIELPEHPLVVVPRTAEDVEAITYLKNYHFNLQARLPSIAAAVAEGRTHIKSVQCPHCQAGELYVPPENFREFQAQSEPSATFYWPEWHSLDDDGTLHVKTTGYVGMSHWTGETEVQPQQPEYTFWRWFVAQPEHRHLIGEEEFERIRADFESRATRRN